MGDNKVLHVPESITPEALMKYVEEGVVPEGGYEEDIEIYLARGRVRNCDCGLMQCVCLQARQHEKGCPYRVALSCAIPFPCRAHGLDVCVDCDVCTCPTRRNPMTERPTTLTEDESQYLQHLFMAQRALGNAVRVAEALKPEQRAFAVARLRLVRSEISRLGGDLRLKTRTPLEEGLVDPEIVVGFLNDLLAIDRNALTVLLETRTPCNEQLAEHPTVQVTPNKEGGGSKVGMLGILNGLCGVDAQQWGHIAAHFDDDKVLQKFSVRSPVQDPVHQDANGAWWFWDETWAGRLGPYANEEEARAKLKEYAASLGAMSAVEASGTG